VDMSSTSWSSGGGCGAGGAEVACELFVEVGDFGAQLGDLFAVDVKLLPQRFDGGEVFLT
jgi:hypothetical protein